MSVADRKRETALRTLCTRFCFALALLAPWLAVQAQVPMRIHYQGYLTSNTGVPVNGPVSLTFRIYDAPSDGNQLWLETQGAVAVTNGNFSVMLGEVQVLNEPMFAAQAWLSVQVAGDPVMSPRQLFASSPNAIHARRALNATSADSATVAGTAGSLSGTITGSQITGTIGTATISGATLAQLQGQFVQATGVQAPQANSLIAVDTVGIVGAYPSITIGADGLPVISYTEAGNGDLKFVRCGNAACSAGNTISTLDSAGYVGTYTSIAIGTDGLPVISYYDQTNGDLKVAKCGDAACAAGNTITAVDTLGNVGTYTSIAIGTDGLPVISYSTSPSSELRVLKCGNAACAAGNSVSLVDTASLVGTYSSMAIGADGRPVISYYDAANLNLKVAKCGNAACSSGNTITAVDTVGNVGTYTAIAIGADGLPVISYHDVTNLDLKVAKCGNAACSAGNTLTAVDTVGNTGQHTSITIGADGLPVISYHDATNLDLKVAKCSNAACSAGNTLTAVDTAGDTGLSTSITIGADGLPVIAYFHSSSSDLKVAKCANVFCSPYFRRR